MGVKVTNIGDFIVASESVHPWIFIGNLGSVASGAVKLEPPDEFDFGGGLKHDCHHL